VISHKHKCIFVHISKTGGTSLEHVLFKSEDTDIAGMLTNNNNLDFPGKHYSAIEYREANPDIFNEYFKFAIVRNPWDRLVSNYFWHKQIELQPVCDLSFEDYIDFVDENVAQYHQYGKVCDDKTIIVDKIYDYEHIRRSYIHICNKLGLDKTTIPVANKTNHKRYTEYYSPILRKRVAHMFRVDIDMFNYEYN